MSKIQNMKCHKCQTREVSNNIKIQMSIVEYWICQKYKMSKAKGRTCQKCQTCQMPNAKCRECHKCQMENVKHLKHVKHVKCQRSKMSKMLKSETYKI